MRSRVYVTVGRPDVRLVDRQQQRRLVGLLLSAGYRHVEIGWTELFKNIRWTFLLGHSVVCAVTSPNIIRFSQLFRRQTR